MAFNSGVFGAALTAATVVLGACANDPDQTVDAGSSSEGPGASPAGVGIVTVQLEPVEGFFIEGFEVGLRFETGAGDVIGSTLWTDYINDQFTDPSMDDYYDSVLRQEVPAGQVVVLATVNIGAGPPPEIPNLAGELRCRLSLDVPPDGEVAVEVVFDGNEDCIRELSTSAPEAPDVGEPTPTCAELDGTEPIVGAFALDNIPPGFTLDGAVEETSTGYADMGGETHTIQRLAHPDGRWIEVDSIAMENAHAYVREQNSAVSMEDVTYDRCVDLNSGPEVHEYQVIVAIHPDRAVVGAQEWEYGGFVISGGPGVAVDELLFIASGLRNPPSHSPDNR